MSFIEFFEDFESREFDEFFLGVFNLEFFNSVVFVFNSDFFSDLFLFSFLSIFWNKKYLIK